MSSVCGFFFSAFSLSAFFCFVFELASLRGSVGSAAGRRAEPTAAVESLPADGAVLGEPTDEPPEEPDEPGEPPDEPDDPPDEPEVPPEEPEPPPPPLPPPLPGSSGGGGGGLGSGSGTVSVGIGSGSVEGGGDGGGGGGGGGGVLGSVVVGDGTWPELSSTGNANVAKRPLRKTPQHRPTRTSRRDPVFMRSAAAVPLDQGHCSTARRDR